MRGIKNTDATSTATEKTGTTLQSLNAEITALSNTQYIKSVITVNGSHVLYPFRADHKAYSSIPESTSSKLSVNYILDEKLYYVEKLNNGSRTSTETAITEWALYY